MIIFMNMPKQTNLIEPTKYDAYKVQLACVKDVSKQLTAKQAAKCHKKKQKKEIRRVAIQTPRPCTQPSSG